MPIDYKKYPKNWKTEIRPAILKRADNKCEICGVENNAIGWRGNDGEFNYSEQYIRVKKLGYGYVQHTGYLKIVLTIAHLDHDITNNSYENLKALCQKCHLNYDKHHHATNSRITRNAKKKQISINF